MSVHSGRRSFELESFFLKEPRKKLDGNPGARSVLIASVMYDLHDARAEGVCEDLMSNLTSKMIGRDRRAHAATAGARKRKGTLELTSPLGPMRSNRGIFALESS